MSKDKIQTNYVSEIDQFLQEFDRTHPTKSTSQQKEIAKAQRVTRLRDQANATHPTRISELWDKF